jgi:hypothetical protein
MIERVWPGNTKTRIVIQGSWQLMPFGSSEFTTILGDGWSSTLNRGDLAQSLHELRRVLAPDGQFVCRLFLRPPNPPSMEELLSNLEQGKIHSGSDLRWQVAQVVQHMLGGIAPTRALIWKIFHDTFGSPLDVAQCHGAGIRSIAMLENYRQSEATLDIPLWDEFREWTQDFFHVASHLSGRF